MAESELQQTVQLHSTEQEADSSSKESGVAGTEDGNSARTNEDVGDRSPRVSGEGKEAASSPPELSSTPPAALNTVDRQDLHSVPSPSAVSPPASAVVSTPARPTLVQLNSSQSHSTSSASTNTTISHPKKFSSVNINKKFLEKTTSAATSPTTMPTASTSTKTAGSTASRPPIQSSSPHPRLITTKLTATAPSPSSAAGWSRPSSTVPSAAATGTNTPNAATPAPPVPSNPLPSSTSAPAGPQLPHTGKLIQPVPRSALTQPQATSSTGHGKDVGSSNNASASSNKHVWGNLKQPSAVAARPEVTTDDFPTAAEVAQGTLSVRKSKSTEQPAKEAPPALPTTSATKRNEEADTFRGVHLDPNAHHWDEMVEDDDNYWDNVIEFGDGRQYKVEAVEQTSSRSRQPSPPASVRSSHSARIEPSDVPVSKEDRFADDFDRSWPSGPSRGPPINTQQRSPQEPSRVLFNERSNKLEPYSNHRAGPGTFPAKRGSLQERTVSPTDSRSGSSGFHGAPRVGGGPADFGSSRSRRFSSTSNSSFVQSNDRDRPRDRDRRDGIPSSPLIPKENFGMTGRTASLRGRDRDSEKDFGPPERGRHTTMGPPPIPTHTWRNASRESTKQRLSTPVSANGPAPFSAGGRRYPSGDSGYPPQNEPSEQSPIARGPPHSPALSHASARAPWVSPATSSLPLPVGQDLEEIKKDVMHSAAERAKQRRQQEEEEREAQKERARKKAAELEAKMKAEAGDREKEQKEEAPPKVTEEQEVKEQERVNNDAEVITFIQEAVDGADKGKDDRLQIQRTNSKQPHRRPTAPLLQHPNDSPHPRRLNSAGGAISPSVAETAETWRRAAPLLQTDEPRLIQCRASSGIAFLPPPPPAPLDHIQTLADGNKEDLEVVDFAEMGKFVGEPEEMETTKKGSRPVASDFFDDAPASSWLPGQPVLPSVARDDIETWRRKTLFNQASAAEQLSGIDHQEVNSTTESPIAAESGHRTNEAQSDARQPNLNPSPSNLQRPPRSQNFYHQAPMSSLVDAMSRIKGALHDMHAEELNRENEVDAPFPATKYKERWTPSSLRGKRVENQEECAENYATIAEWPSSLPPSPGSFVVQLPSECREREPVQRKLLNHFLRPPYPLRWDILSFDPPVEGMKKRNFSLNDVLFPTPTGGYRSKPKYRVQLPRSKTFGARTHLGGPNSAKGNSFGVFGKHYGADAATSWRKPTSPLPAQGNKMGEEVPRAVDPTSCSPLETEGGNNNQGEASSNENPASMTRMRSQPKMPEGSCVAFYRDSRIDVPETDLKTTVSFIVSSEIEDSHAPQPQVARQDAVADSSRTNELAIEVEEPTAEQKLTDITKPTFDRPDEKVASPHKSDSSSVPPVADTNNCDKPSRQSSPWLTTKGLPVKDSPARAPDPELLKAVWSQTSNDKAGLHVNSLEGIADDLTTLPFTIQDVKSEDGETPPPVPVPSTTRMSLHDVTRAFQQVPSSSASAPHKPSISPPSTTAPVARPPPSNFSYPVPPNNMRPAAYPYPSPMMSHSPSPTMMYPHMVSSPVPTRMQANGHAPMYNGPPMWVPVQAPAQNSNGMVRPMASPYGAPMMPYPTNGGPAVYASMTANMPGTPQTQNLQANRNRNVPMISPVMQHATSAPMFPGSPAMMHIPMTPTTGYIPLPAGRGQPRPENGQMGTNSASTSHVGFSPVPHSPYMRYS